MPFEVANRIISQQNGVFLILLDQIYSDERLQNYPHRIIPLGKIGKIIRTIKAQKIENIMMIGGMNLPDFKAIKPDILGAVLIWKILRLKNRGDNAILTLIAGFVEKKGIKILNPIDFLPANILKTSKSPTKEQQNDIEFGVKILGAIADFDIAQSVAICNGRVIGIEAAEGTDELIARCKKYRENGRFTGNPVLVKLIKTNQDTRLDAPTIGEKTIKNLVESGFCGIAINPKNTILDNPGQIQQLAEENNIFIYNI